ncbi:TPA: hypothetical protein ACX3FU_004450 [Vibrio parahaemolyticus]|uniref:hypothetical protein n=1 Tax=Vibrio harveyi group TaxID=717610 RepID=UPI00112357AF|nr:hypothetical protein [Vibrio parahaemolyticus]TOG32986.1 hypothetical protein CGJ03_23640 [Vibrio parahaemolyticus]
MDELDPALLSAVSALVGATIPTVVGYFNNRASNKHLLKLKEIELKAQREKEEADELRKEKERNNEKQDKLSESRKVLYLELVLSLQNLMNKINGENLKSFQLLINKISVLGDVQVAESANKYYLALINKGGSLTEEEHNSMQRELLNSIRHVTSLPTLNLFSLVKIPENI